MAVQQFKLLNKSTGLFKFRLGLAGKADNDIRRKTQIRHFLLQVGDIFGRACRVLYFRLIRLSV